MIPILAGKAFTGTALHPTASRRHLAVVALVLLACAALASQSPAPASGPASGLKEFGHGRLSLLGFRIDEASLWSPDGRCSGFEPARGVALWLADQRGFTRAELIKITTGELARLGLANPDARQRWSGLLGALWRDVGPGAR